MTHLIDNPPSDGRCPHCGFDFAKPNCILGDEGKNYHAWCLVYRLRMKIDNLTAERDESRRKALEEAAKKCAWVREGAQFWLETEAAKSGESNSAYFTGRKEAAGELGEFIRFLVTAEGAGK
jgi:hypothetical protein